MDQFFYENHMWKMYNIDYIYLWSLRFSWVSDTVDRQPSWMFDVGGKNKSDVGPVEVLYINVKAKVFGKRIAGLRAIFLHSHWGNGDCTGHLLQQRYVWIASQIMGQSTDKGIARTL